MSDLKLKNRDKEDDIAVLINELASIKNGICKNSDKDKKTIDEAISLIKYLSEHHDECHTPAAKYSLLLEYLKGEPVHINCPVLEELERLRKINEPFTMLDISDEIMNVEWFLGDDLRDLAVCCYVNDKDILCIFSANKNLSQEVRIKLHQRVINLHNSELKSRKNNEEK